MTDKELLELAAKAAGIELIQMPPGIYRNTTGARSETNAFGLPTWNPLTDDGDALRLAVKLRKLPVIEKWSDGHEWVFIPGHEDEALPLGNDPLAATRRAIVMAAAEIGKEMK